MKVSCTGAKPVSSIHSIYRYICMRVFICIFKRICMYESILHWSQTCEFYTLYSYIYTGWRRLIGSPKLQIIFHKRANKYRSLLRKMTYQDMGPYESSPPCMYVCIHVYVNVYVYIHRYTYTCIFSYRRYIYIYVYIHIDCTGAKPVSSIHYIYIYICMYVCICIFECMCIYT